MPMLRRRRGSADNHETLDFIETTQYEYTSASTTSSNQPLPRGWRKFEHPNGDIYYHNSQLRATTMLNIRDPTMYERVVDARDNHLEALDDDVAMRRLPPDLELVLFESSDTTPIIFVKMYSRARGEGYTWIEDDGLVLMSREEYWTHVAEFPSHHRELPPNAENEFVQALAEARENVTRGVTYPFNERQLDMMLARYQALVEARAQGRNATPSLGWLIGASMPISPTLRPSPAPPEDREMYDDTDDDTDDDGDEDTDEDMDDNPGFITGRLHGISLG